MGVHDQENAWLLESHVAVCSLALGSPPDNGHLLQAHYDKGVAELTQNQYSTSISLGSCAPVAQPG